MRDSLGERQHRSELGGSSASRCSTRSRPVPSSATWPVKPRRPAPQLAQLARSTATPGVPVVRGIFAACAVICGALLRPARDPPRGHPARKPRPGGREHDRGNAPRELNRKAGPLAEYRLRRPHGPHLAGARRRAPIPGPRVHIWSRWRGATSAPPGRLLLHALCLLGETRRLPGPRRPGRRRAHVAARRTRRAPRRSGPALAVSCSWKMKQSDRAAPGHRPP